MDEREILITIKQVNKNKRLVARDLQIVTEARIALSSAQLLYYINLVQQKIYFDLIRATIHSSPGLIAILSAIFGIFKFLYDNLTIIVTVLKIRELLKIAKFLSIIWPAFRTKMNAIFKKVSEFSEKVGWGADGLAHLINAASAGVNVLAGITGKGREWSNIFMAERAITALNTISEHAALIAKDPGYLLDIAYRNASHQIQRETTTKWNETMAWLNDTASKAEEVAKKIGETSSELLEFKNKMPQFVRDHIPMKLFTGLAWVDDQVNNNILPVLTELSKELDDTVSDIEQQRIAAERLALRLAKPGNVLLGVDNLSDQEKKQQEIYIDDVTSRIYEEEADQAIFDNEPVFRFLRKIQDLAALDLPEPQFNILETGGRPGIIWDKAELVKGWFVGDF